MVPSRLFLEVYELVLVVLRLLVRDVLLTAILLVVAVVVCDARRFRRHSASARRLRRLSAFARRFRRLLESNGWVVLISPFVP